MIQKSKRDQTRLLQALEDFKALTRREAANLLNADPRALQNAFFILQSKNLIHRVDVWENHPRAKYKLFPWYAGKRLYFIDKPRLREWIQMQLPPPEKTSKVFQRILRTRIKKNFGMELRQNAQNVGITQQGKAGV